MSQPELTDPPPPPIVVDVSNENPSDSSDVESVDTKPTISASQLPLPSDTETETTIVANSKSNLAVVDVKDESADPEEKKVPSTPSLFMGDIVVRRMPPKPWDYTPSFGTVLKQPLYGNVQDNQPKTFNIRWEANSTVERLRPDQVSVVDRLVTRNTKVENVEGVSGVVRDWGVTCSVQLVGTNHVVEKVPLERMHPISSFIRGQEILFQDWVGVITSVTRNIWFLMDGGAGFFVPVTEAEGTMRADPYWGLGIPCPGIRTRLTGALMRKAVWISGPMTFFSKVFPPLSYIVALAHVTINRSEVVQAEVNWLRAAPNSRLAHPRKPENILDRKTLNKVTVIGVPSSETLGINSIRMLKLKPEDSLTNYPSWLGAFRKRFVNGIDGAEPIRSPISSTATLRLLATERVYEVPVKVLARSSVVEVEWSNGNVEKLPAVKIAKIVNRVEDNEFITGMVVSPIYSPLKPEDLYGVVLDSEEFAIVKARKVNVMWILNGNVLEVRVESIFNLKPHSMYSMYERGTIVFPRTPGKFRAAVVCDLNIAVGKLVVTVTADNSQHEVYPHTVTPLGFRCYWNFFTRSWNIDDIVVPPYQLLAEFGPAQRYVNVAEPSPEVLSNVGTNNDGHLKNAWDEPGFEMLAFAPSTHRYYNIVPPTQKYGKKFSNMIANEISLLQKQGSVPEGIWVRCYENRLDLLSALMIGPSETPYEDGIFMLDLQVDGKFPFSPPKIHFVSYSYEVSPNMAWDGNFCTSALDWKKQGNEVGDGSYIAHCLRQIQALIFSPEPLLAGPRDFVDINSPRRKEISKLYNEFVVLRVLDSAWNMIHRPAEPWTELIKSHFASVLPDKLAGYEQWISSVESMTGEDADATLFHAKFPLFPVSQGFVEAFAHRIERFKKISPAIGSVTPASLTPPPTALVTDVTADSESVPVSAEEVITKQLVEPSPNYNDNPEVLLTLEKSKTQTPMELLDVGSILVPKKEPLTATTSELDSDKNLLAAAVEGKGKKSHSPGKGKLLAELALAATVVKAPVEDVPAEVSKVESDHGTEDEVVGEEPEPVTEPRPTSATE